VRRIKFFIHFIVITAIMSAAISPACAFISGNYGDWIEICAGLTKQKVQTGEQSQAPDVTQHSCDFCFYNFHMNAIETAESILPVLKRLNSFSDFIDETALIAFYQSYQSRAPPFIS
jgi:hypothetical protein